MNSVIKYNPRTSTVPIPRVEETRVALVDFLIQRHEPDCADAPDCECRAVWVRQLDAAAFLRARGMTYTAARAEIRRCVELGLIERREIPTPGNDPRLASLRTFQVRVIPPRGLAP